VPGRLTLLAIQQLWTHGVPYAYSARSFASPATGASGRSRVFLSFFPARHPHALIWMTYSTINNSTFSDEKDDVSQPTTNTDCILFLIPEYDV